jgi:hypothetical protein
VSDADQVFLILEETAKTPEFSCFQLKIREIAMERD